MRTSVVTKVATCPLKSSLPTPNDNKALTIPVMGMIIPTMGIKSSPKATAIEPLFSPVQRALLAVLYGQPDRRVHGAELIRAAGSGVGATHRQLKQLTAAGLLRMVPIGNQKFYQANSDSPIFEELHSIVLKTIGLAQPLRTALAPIKSRVRAAFVYGSIAAGTERAESDIDLMVISDTLDYSEVFRAMQNLEGDLGRKINPTVITPADWGRKRSAADSFASRVASGPKIWVIGDEDAIA